MPGAETCVLSVVLPAGQPQLLHRKQEKEHAHVPGRARPPSSGSRATSGSAAGATLLASSPGQDDAANGAWTLLRFSAPVQRTRAGRVRAGAHQSIAAGLPAWDVARSSARPQPAPSQAATLQRELPQPLPSLPGSLGVNAPAAAGPDVAAGAAAAAAQPASSNGWLANLRLEPEEGAQAPPTSHRCRCSRAWLACPLRSLLASPNACRAARRAPQCSCG